MTDSRTPAYPCDDKALKAKAAALHADGLNFKTIAAQVGVTAKTVSRWLRVRDEIPRKKLKEPPLPDPIAYSDLQKECPRCGGDQTMTWNGEEMTCLMCGHHVYHVSLPPEVKHKTRMDGMNGRFIAVPPYQPTNGPPVPTNRILLVEVVRTSTGKPSQSPQERRNFLQYRIYCPYDRHEMVYAAGWPHSPLVDSQGDWCMALLNCPKFQRITVHHYGEYPTWSLTPKGGTPATERRRCLPHQ